MVFFGRTHAMRVCVCCVYNPNGISGFVFALSVVGTASNTHTHTSATSTRLETHTQGIPGEIVHAVKHTKHHALCIPVLYCLRTYIDCVWCADQSPHIDAGFGIWGGRVGVVDTSKRMGVRRGLYVRGQTPNIIVSNCENTTHTRTTYAKTIRKHSVGDGSETHHHNTIIWFHIIINIISHKSCR